ncbi:MAG TPA: YdcF family protein [Chitinophagaceae bacterium]|nr:YdcF family protein [Chitinophagaceae bacterium]
MNHQQGKWLQYLQATFVCWLLSSCSYSSKTQHRLYTAVANEQLDAIIVPGIPFENGVWGRLMQGRVYWAKYLYDKGIAKNIIFSGSAVYTPYYEGKIMAMYAIALGVPAAHVFTEDLAEHSTENIFYSYQLAKKLGFQRIGVASDPFQTRLLRKYAHKKVDPSIKMIPFVTDTLRLLEPTMTNPPINYQQAFKKDFVSIKKREGLLKRWRGTRGKNVDRSAYK